MTTNPETDGAFPSWVQISFYATAIVFNLCLIAQVLTVGVAYFTDSTWWAVHVQQFQIQILTRGKGKQENQETSPRES